ncbi:phage major capsid protein [Rhodococcus sp. ZPP]|uniref:phage major capsid protein n=1 Tax=Rhodococcus sp. ZPP TaxID=2749906 RepID=UPI001AD89261|nr:phage major capsid protein [Rhodococcus sp. ZPP]QTJ64981.1 phage major capsid protein [Rhodococcus sp. ZPP]
MRSDLPKHPITGLTALGLTKRGAPIWPILGGDGTKDGRTTDDTRSAPTLTHSQAVRRLEEILPELERLGEVDELTADDEQLFAELTREWNETDEHRKRLERAADLAAVRTAATQVTSSRRLRTERGSAGGSSREDYDRDPILEPDSIEEHRFRNPWDLSEVRTFGRDADEVAGELRARALSAVEKMQGASDNVRQAATQILERFDDKQSTLARQCLLTSSPAYLRAWSKMARNQQHALSAEESRAIAEVRAMSLTDANGGYLVPFQLDPTVIVTSDGSRNDIRRFARQVIATGDKWNGVSAGAVSWSWDSEGTEVSDDSPTLGQPSIDVHKASGFVPISIEALEDEQNVTAEVAKLLAAGKDDIEAPAFITGSGTGQPKGLITALSAVPGSIVAPATAETFSLADVYALRSSLPARYRTNAAWLANDLIYSKIRQFDTAGGAGLWTYLGGDRPDELIGKPVGEAEDMDDTLNPAVTSAHNFLLAFGDLSNYVIADRVGMSVEFIPHLFGANRRPTGQRGWFAYYRTGADVVNAGGIRVLDIPTTL